MPETERQDGGEGDGQERPESRERAARRRWLGLLARAEESRLEAAWEAVGDKPEYETLRRPDVGLVMVRGRTGGSGRAFNLGEMTATRCAVRLKTGALGFGYVAGRKPRHAELIALFDGLLQDEDRRAALEDALLAPIEADLAARRAAMAAKTAGTRVDFFTMVRGD
jgi:alpha-D-ribose 1-methylphosphonate 5-triphosphate synthase subunit PhnG